MLPPSIIEELDYERITSELKDEFIAKFDKIPQLLESDEYSKLIECFAYRELNLRADINRRIRALLIDYATGSDLDHLALTLYRIKRLPGTYPRARISFELAAPRAVAVMIPKGALLHSNDAQVARLVDDVIINKQTLSAVGVMELLEHEVTSSAKCELLQTQLPFVLAKCSQLESFSGGASTESDEAFRQRAKLSIHRFSTAGSAAAYVYHALAADARVQDAVASDLDNAQGGRAYVFIKASEQSDELLAKVQAYLSEPHRRPLCAQVICNFAKERKICIKATIYMHDLSAANSFKIPQISFKIGQSYAISKVYASLEQPGVSKVELENEFLALTPSAFEYLVLEYLLEFRSAL